MVEMFICFESELTAHIMQVHIGVCAMSPIE